jgi:hypothetical protein
MHKNEIPAAPALRENIFIQMNEISSIGRCLNVILNAGLRDFHAAALNVQSQPESLRNAGSSIAPANPTASVNVQTQISLALAQLMYHMHLGAARNAEEVCRSIFNGPGGTVEVTRDRRQV